MRDAILLFIFDYMICFTISILKLFLIMNPELCWIYIFLFAGNDIRDVGASDLAKGLQSNTVLRSLSLASILLKNTAQWLY